MPQAAEEGKPKMARRAKAAQAELPGAVDGGEDEDVAEAVEKPKRRRGKQPDPNAPPPFGESYFLPTIFMQVAESPCVLYHCLDSTL